MKPELDKLLCERYPKLFADRHARVHESLMCFGFECGDGWFDLIDTLCSTIQDYIDYNPGKNIPQVIVVQVKEKFGTLRFYTTGGDDMTRGMIWMAESMSGRVCEVCGKPGEVRDGGWIKTRCGDHV
jgi:hypothetical protein